MKIGIDARTLMDERYSGVSEYSLNLLLSIFSIDKRNEYTLFYNSFSDIGKRLPIFDLPNVKTVKWNLPNKFLNYFLFKPFNRPMIDLELGVDIFFMPHINFIGLSKKANNILTIHDLSFLKHPEFFSIRKNFWHKMLVVKKLITRSEKIIAVSKSTGNDLADILHIPEEKIAIIHSGIGSEFKPMSQDEPRLKEIGKKYGLEKDFILYLGNIEPRKNISGLINAFNRLKRSDELKNFKLAIVGGLGWRNKVIFKDIENSPFKKDIILLGYVKKEEKPYIYNMAKVFVYPSFYEGFGFPPLEAMASGLPVVASNTTSLPEILKDSAILVDPYNSTDLSNAIRSIVSQPGIEKYLKEKGIERAKRFLWDECAQKHIDVFGSVEKK